jgi:serine protease Do
VDEREEWGEHREDDPGMDYPLAPTPPHERVWRHPSELAATTVREMPTATAVGRGFFIITSVATLALAMGLVRVLAAEPNTSVVAGGARSVAPVAAATSSTLPAPSASVRDAPTTLATSLTTIPGSAAPNLPAPPPTLLTAFGAAAILWADGTWAVTVADGLSVDQSTEVQLPDGSARAAIVLAIDADSGLAVLALSDPASSMPPAPDVDSLPAAGSTVVAVSRDGAAVMGTLIVVNDELLVEPHAPADLASGTPLTDERGSVVGLCGRSRDGRAKVLDLAAVAELVKGLPGGWIGISGRLTDLGVVVVDVAAGSPADSAGLLPDDVITHLDGHAIEALDWFSRDVRRRSPGTTAVVTLRRGDEVVELELTVGDRQDHSSRPVTTTSAVSSTTTTVTTSVTTPTTTTTTVAPGATTAPGTDPTVTTSEVASVPGVPTPTTSATLPRTTAPSQPARAPASASA